MKNFTVSEAGLILLVVLRVCTSWCTPDEYVDKFIDMLKEL